MPRCWQRKRIAAPLLTSLAVISQKPAMELVTSAVAPASAVISAITVGKTVWSIATTVSLVVPCRSLSSSGGSSATTAGIWAMLE
jgi:hypothetical protein